MGLLSLLWLIWFILMALTLVAILFHKKDKKQ